LLRRRTCTLTIDPFRPDWAAVRWAAAAIRRGEVIAIPTDTVYGLAGDAMNPGIAERIFRIKRRPETKPILLLVATVKQVAALVRDVPEEFEALARTFWPGPLTMILPANSSIPTAITAGTGNVAVRCPGSPFVRALARACGRPLTGTSANRSGLPAALTAGQVERQLGRDVYYIVDGGRAPSSRPSTIVDLTDRPRIVRPGAVSAARLSRYLR
jgi:L-threonylcarbamoyladenylate synthase